MTAHSIAEDSPYVVAVSACTVWILGTRQRE
jgi:hypothetical protein